MTDDEVRARIAAVSHWYHPIEVGFVCEAISRPAAAYYMEIVTGRRAPESISS